MIHQIKNSLGFSGTCSSKSKKLVQELTESAGINLDQDVNIFNEKFYDLVLIGDSLALGETYMDGWWNPKEKSLDEISFKIGQEQLQNKIRKISLWKKFKLIWTWIWLFLWFKITRWFPKFGISKSKVVAEKHYDLGNELYEYMLDPSLSYSCGYFRNSENMDNSKNSDVFLEDLNQSQVDKMELIRLKLQLTPGQKVLDIGCGWGSLANYLMKKSHVQVDGLTISKEQFNFAQKKYPQVNFYLEDYRTFQPDYQYDAIVSVGMFEHVNPHHYEEYMHVVYNLLKPGGLFLLHTIGGNVSRLTGDPWISKYIFPNSCLPTLSQLSKSAEGKFVIEDVHNFGPHYDKTLMCWYHNFVQNFDLINQERIDKNLPELDSRFYRMWEYYLLMCAGLFRSRQCQLYQTILSKNRLEAYIRPDF